MKSCRCSIIWRCTGRPAARRSSRPWRLPPAQKWAPAPRSTTTRTSSLASLAPSASMPAAMTCVESVLRVAGSLIVRTSVAPRRSLRSSAGIAPHRRLPHSFQPHETPFLHSRNCVTQADAASPCTRPIYRGHMLESFGPEHDAMPRLSLHSALGTALLLTSPLAMALGFGPTRNLTTLGQPLNFAATVVVDADETVSRDCVKAEVFAGDNPVAARHVRAVLEVTRDPGQRIVRVTTSVAIDEPVVTLEVSIGCGSRVSRRFVAFIDPPAMHLAETVAPSETVPLPSSRIDSQVAALADVARQADASRRRAESNARGDDSEQPPRAPRRAPRTPAPVVVASATPVADTKPRKPPTAARRNESKTRTALAAAPRTGGAGLQLDPPRMLAALRLTPTPPAPAAVPTTIAPANPAGAAGPASAPLMLAHAETDPLLAQVAAAAAAAAGASTPALTPAQERVQLLEAEVARMRGESQATQQTVAALQARVRQAEEARFRNVLVYILAATTLLGLLAAALLWWLRPRQRSRARWFDAQARQQALAAARAGPSTSAGLASQPAPLSRPLGLTPSPARPAPPPAPLRSGQPSGWNSGTSSLMPTTQHSAIGGLEVTTVLGPELSRPSVESFGGGGASLRPGGELTMEELIDLEQQ